LLAKYLADDRRGRDECAVLRDVSDRASLLRVPSESHPLLGMQAPAFALLDAAGYPWSLDEKLRRGPVVLVFYIGYTCDACVTNLFELNADFRMWQAAGVELAAISGDAAELTGRRFRRYGRFSFPVLSDPGHEIAESYSTLRRSEGDIPEKLLHGTFLIGKDRRIRWAQTGDSPFTNYAALLAELTQLRGERTEADQSETALAETAQP
jgi:peroxiredoxin